MYLLYDVTLIRVQQGRLAQRKSTRFTREGSLVQIQYRPPFPYIHLLFLAGMLAGVGLWRLAAFAATLFVMVAAAMRAYVPARAWYKRVCSSQSPVLLHFRYGHDLASASLVAPYAS